MGWTAGADVSTGDLITAAQWNNYMGATGSFEYLKAVADLAILEDGSNAFAADQPMGGFSLTGLAASAAAGESVRHEQLAAASFAEPARAIDATIYQNSTKIRIISITVRVLLSAADGDLLDDAYIQAHSDSDTPPTVSVGLAGSKDTAIKGLGVEAQALDLRFNLMFVVLPSEYYKVTATTANDGTCTLVEWIEWDLH